MARWCSFAQTHGGGFGFRMPGAGEQLRFVNAHMVVGRRADQIRGGPPAGQYQQVAVADAGMEHGGLVSFSTAQIPIQVPDEDGGFFAADMTCAVILDAAVWMERQQIAAQGHIGGIQIHAHAGGFQHATALQALPGVVAQHGENRHIGTIGHAFGNGGEEPCNAFTGNAIHGRFAGHHERRLALQGLHGEVRHAIAQDDHGFRQRYSFSRWALNVA